MRQWRRSGRALMILVVSTGVIGRRLSYWSRKLELDHYATVALLHSKCAISQNMKSQGRSVLQYNAKQDLISISKKNFFDMLVIQILFSDKRMAIPWIEFFFMDIKQSVWPFSGLFLALFGFLLKLSSGNPGSFMKFKRKNAKNKCIVKNLIFTKCFSRNPCH